MSESRRSRSLSRPAAEFLGWWWSELRDLVPGWLQRAINPPPRKIAIAFDNSTVHIIDHRPNGKIRTLETITNHTEVVARLTAAFSGGGKGTAGSLFGVRLPASALLERRIELPIAARKQAAGILAFDLEQATPFKADQIYTAHYLGEGTAGGKHVMAHQFVAKRETLDRAMDLAAAAGLDIRFADTYRERVEFPLPINFLAADAANDGHPHWQARAAATLAASILGLGTLLLYQMFDNQARTLSLLQARTAVVQSKAIKVRKQIETSQAALDGQQALLQRKVGPPTTVQIIEELTRILPDTAWISELRVERGSVEVVGFSRSAATLVPLVENSPLFQNAALSSPVTLDPRYGTERFSIRCDIKSAASAFHEISAVGSR